MTTAPGFPLDGDGDTRFTRQGLVRAVGRLSAPLLFALLPAVLMIVVVGGSVHDHFAFDFRQFWQGGRDVIAGHSPYPPADSIPAGGDASLGAAAIQEVYRFPYPAPAALAMVPFGALPFSLAAALFVALSTAAVFLALRLLGVSDWRCHGLAFASIVTLGALRLGTFTPLLLLGLAVAWRFRDRVAVAAPVVAGLIMAKLFLWPLLVWLAVSRRTGTAAVAFVVGIFVTLGSWAAIGFAGLADYPDLLSSLAQTVQGEGWSTAALGLAVGLPPAAAKAVVLALGGMVFAVVAFAPGGRRDLWSFTLAIVVAILLSPIVWLHYFLLLVAPLAIAFPALAWPWFVLLAFWVWPFQETGGDVWKIALGLAALTSIAAATLLAARRPGPLAAEVAT